MVMDMVKDYCWEAHIRRLHHSKPCRTESRRLGNENTAKNEAFDRNETFVSKDGKWTFARARGEFLKWELRMSVELSTSPICVIDGIECMRFENISWADDSLSLTIKSWKHYDLPFKITTAPCHVIVIELMNVFNDF